MTSWTPPHQPRTEERPWLGLVMLSAVGFLVLLLLRVLWSGSGMWYLVLGLLLIGGAAVVAFMRRQPGQVEPMAGDSLMWGSRFPVAVAGVGVLLLALLLVPTVGSGESEEAESASPVTITTPVSSVSGAMVTPQPADTSATGAVGTYVVESGDTLWDIAERFGTSVEDLVEANSLENPADLTVGQELEIPGAAP
jgi:LysM repeat protein